MRLQSTMEGDQQYPLTLQVFGTSQVKLHGELVEFKPRKCRWILLLLAIAAAEGRSLSKREVSLALWPWSNGDEYSVHRHMAALRESLGTEAHRVELSGPHTLKLNLEECDCDIVGFHQALREAVRATDPSVIEAELDWRPSRLLMDFPEDDALSLDLIRRKLRTRFQRPLDEVAERARGMANWDVVARAALLMIDENPSPDERRTGMSMLAESELGRPSGAVRAYEIYRSKGGEPTEYLNGLLTRRPTVQSSGDSRHIVVPAVDASSVSKRIRQELAACIVDGSNGSSLREYLRNAPHLLVGSANVHSGVVFSGVIIEGECDADFAFLEPQSGRSYIHLVRFASLDSRIFTEAEDLSPEFNRECERMEAYAFWIGRHQLDVPALFSPRLEAFAGAPLTTGFFVPACTLVIGRRAELVNERRITRLEARRAMGSPNLSIRTYDGFLELIGPTVRTDPLNERGILCIDHQAG